MGVGSLMTYSCEIWSPPIEIKNCLIERNHWEIFWCMICHYSDVMMNAMAFQITIISIVYSTVCSGAYQRKHQMSASLAFVRGIHRWPVNSSHIGPVTWKMLPFNVIMCLEEVYQGRYEGIIGFWQTKIKEKIFHFCCFDRGTVDF